MNMKHAGRGKGYKILNLIEMLDGENKPVKEFAIRDLKDSKIKKGKYAHDCACRYLSWEGRLVDKLYLDGYHSEYHKCKMKAIKYSPTRNSQAAEQLWSRLDNFCPVVPAMSRAHYRYFWLNCAKWRNDFVRSEFYTADVCPMVTRKKLRLHGKI